MTYKLGFLESKNMPSTYPTKAKLRLYEQAFDWDAETRAPGKHGGIIGRAGLAVLRALIIEFKTDRPGHPQPSRDALREESGISTSSLSVALTRLRDLGIISLDPASYKVQPPTAWRR